MAKIHGAIIAAFISTVGPSEILAQTSAQLCTETGVCGSVEPMTALIIIGVQTIADEINKGDEGFGPNGFIIKSVNTVLGDLRNGGLGPNNDLIKALETIHNDLFYGMGENNDIIQALKRIGVHF